MNRIFRYALLVMGACLALSPVYAAEVRGFYIPSFTYDSTNDNTAKANIDEAIANAVQHKFNAIYLQVRRRGDLYYFANRNSSKYPNPEPRATTISSTFDPLQYTIDKGHEQGLKIIAWLVTYPTWSSGTPPAAANHVYNAHPTWITQDASGVYASPTVAGQEAALDPGRQEVQDYLTNIYLDVVRNYDVDGIHFDYFRLPENGRSTGSEGFSKFGFNTGSLAKFTDDTGLVYNPASDTNKVAQVYRQWMREQLDNLAKRVWEGTKKEKPWVEVSSFIINFDDSPKALAQSYNMWTNRNHFDYIVGGSYDDGATVSSYWTRESNYVKIPGTTTLSRPIVYAAGSDPSFGNTASSIVTTVNTVRGFSNPSVSGIVHFAYAGLAGSSEAMFSALSSGPYATADSYPGPSIMNALSLADTNAPNAPTGAAATVDGGSVVVTFNRPAQAGDGDYPVQYRIYRDTVASPKEYYDNQKMEFWDVPSTRSSFSWTDTTPVSGGYYKIIAYDDWFNKASVTVGPVATGVVSEMIIETGTGGQNVAKYSETGGGFFDSTAKSTAPGLTASVSRFSSNAAIASSGIFTPGLTGTYDLYITVDAQSNISALSTTYQVSGGGPSGNIPLSGTNSAMTDKWYKFASNVALTPSLTITISEASPQADRFNLDAIRLVNVGGGGSTPWETKPELYTFPAPTFPVNSTVIADDGYGHGGSSLEPNFLNYDDDRGAPYTTSSFGTNYNSGLGNYARYADAAAEKSIKSVFSVDLPVAGQYDIRAWVTNGTYTTSAKYQFRAYADSSLTTLNTYTITTTQSSLGTGFVVHVDGQSTDANSYWFKAGKAFVAVWDDAANTQILRNDALQFKLISTVNSSVDDWMLYGR